MYNGHVFSIDRLQWILRQQQHTACCHGVVFDSNLSPKAFSVYRYFLTLVPNMQSICEGKILITPA